MSNVRLYNSDTAPVTETGPSSPPPNPQAMLSEAQESFTSIGASPPLNIVGPRTISLRRTGERPFRFQGTELCSAIGWAQNITIWHEINLFRANTGKLIVDIRVFRKSPDEKDLFRVFELDTLEDAITLLENYDPTQDVLVDLPLDDPSVSLATLSLQGVVLRQKIEQTRRQYDALLGDLLHEIERQR